jgi:hypothetical protein
MTKDLFDCSIVKKLLSGLLDLRTKAYIGKDTQFNHLEKGVCKLKHFLKSCMENGFVGHHQFCLFLSKLVFEVVMGIVD